MDTRNIKRLMAVLEHIAVIEKNNDAVVLATTSPSIPELTLWDIKNTIHELKALMGAQKALENIKNMLT